MEKTENSPLVWFSEYFGIYKPQYELPFIDFLLDRDVPLYIDSYAIARCQDKLGKDCHRTIASFFQCLLNAAKEKDTLKLNRLVQNKLVEPKQIYLGVATKARTGVGLGPNQERQLVEALSQSAALKTGFIQDIQELELHIDSLGFDKISDLVGNIIKGHLAEYTTEICSKYGIETTPCAVSYFWDSSSESWSHGYFNLPVRDNDEYILVPKRFVRRKDDLVNHGTFYRKYVRAIFLTELRTATASLAATLQSAPPIITYKDLQKHSCYALNKKNVSRFISEHPEVMSLYREDLMANTTPLDPAIFSGRAGIDDEIIYRHLKKLDRIPYGTDYASEYHSAVLELLKFVFDWCFRGFDQEYSVNQGQGCIDIICENYATDGLFGQLAIDLNATFIPIECKNYALDTVNTEFNQLDDKLRGKTSRLGFLFCRRTIQPANVAKPVTNRWLSDKRYILVFNDDEIKKLTQLRLMRDFLGIESYIDKKRHNVVSSSKEEKITSEIITSRHHSQASNYREKLMEESESIDKYQVNSNSTMQRQAIIDNNIVHQHYYSNSTSSKDKEMQKIKALFLAANPSSTSRLAIDDETRAIEQKFRAAEHRDALVFQSAWAVQPDDLLQLLNQHQPHIVHFSGHGSSQGLCLAGENGQARLVSAQALKSLFTTLKDNIRLVFLNACYSREQALALVETIDCVIGMKKSIYDNAATAFASSFYRAVGFGRSIQEAFEQGITSLLLEGIPQEDIPELLVKEGVDAKKVLLIAPANP